jgi:hypothetical protein
MVVLLPMLLLMPPRPSLRAPARSNTLCARPPRPRGWPPSSHSRVLLVVATLQELRSLLFSRTRARLSLFVGARRDTVADGQRDGKLKNQ